MPITQTPQGVPFPVRAIEELQPGVERFSPLPTALNIRQRKLFGIPLTSSLTGETLSDDTIEFNIKAAISDLEHTLDIYITPVKFYEKHDYKRDMFMWSYCLIKLNHNPILNVEKVELSFTNDQTLPGFVQFPMEHVHVMNQEGTINLVPAFGTSLSGFLLSAFSGSQFHALSAMGVTDFPGGIRVQYTAGFEMDKIPATISQLIETMTAINILSLMGPVLFPMNSISVGIDGVSQSSGSSGVRHFMERIDLLTKERDRLLDNAKGYYQKRFLIDFL